MATVTGYTATRMQAIEDSAIVSGAIVGDDLILTRFDTSTVNAGNVRGPQGIQGPTGEVSTADMNAAIAAAVTGGTIDASGLAAAAVTTDKIADNAVTAAKIASSAVQANEIASGAVTNAKLAANAVGTSKIADFAVTQEKIAEGAITYEMLDEPFLDPETIAAENGWGGNIYYMGWKNLVFFMYSNLAVSGPTSDVVLNWPFGFRPIRPINIPCQTNTDGIMTIDTAGQMSIPRTGLTSIIITSFFEREQFA